MIYKKIRKGFKLILEGKNLQDKIKIALWFFGIKESVFLKNKDGIFHVRENSDDLWMLSPFGESEIREYFKLEEGTFLDIGANVGKYSVMIAKQLKEKGKVYSFEPEPSNIKSLERNLSLNKIRNVKIIPIACSDKKGKIDFYIDKENSGGHSMVKKTDEKITVDSDKLDSIVNKNKIKDIRLIKIDVEGAEFRVLKGAEKTLKKFKPKIIFECWEGNLERTRLFLENLNYKIEKISSLDYFAY